MIKLDIVNEVVNRTSITKTKAEIAVETVFEAMKKALTQGDRIELRGFAVQCEGSQDWYRAEPPNRGGSQHPPRQSCALQARQGTAISLTYLQAARSGRE